MKKKFMAAGLALVLLAGSFLPSYAQNTTSPTLEVYEENGSVQGIQITNNLQEGEDYVHLYMENESYGMCIWSESMQAEESRIIPFEEFEIWNPEAGVYHLKVRSIETSTEAVLEYPVTIYEENNTGNVMDLYVEYDEENGTDCYYLSADVLPEKSVVLEAQYTPVEGEWEVGSIDFHKSLDGNQWIARYYYPDFEIRIDGVTYYYPGTADRDGASFTVVNVPEEKLNVTRRELSERKIAILDYDHYMSFIASGGSVIFDQTAEDVISVSEEFKDQDNRWSLEGFINLVKGSEIYQQLKWLEDRVLKAANRYWFSAEGEFEATGIYDTDGNEISEESMSEHEIVLVKYEPEIVWVDSMELTAPAGMEKNETAVVTAAFDAGQDKYPFNRTPQVRYASSNSDVLMVDPVTGVLTAGNQDGVAVITAYADEALRAQEGLDTIVTATAAVRVGDGKFAEEVFGDVAATNWYTPYVQYVFDQGLMSGSDGMFKPTNHITRAQVITTLYRLVGSPEVTDYSACEELTDVQKNKYYTDAVCWAYNTGITTGNPNTKLFNVNTPVTREQLSTFVYRYAINENLDTSAAGDISDMLNADKVGIYAKTAVEWAVGAGVISGSQTTDSNGNTVYDLKPQATATRAQMAAILQRFCEQYGL